MSNFRIDNDGNIKSGSFVGNLTGDNLVEIEMPMNEFQELIKNHHNKKIINGKIINKTGVEIKSFWNRYNRDKEIREQWVQDKKNIIEQAKIDARDKTKTLEERLNSQQLTDDTEAILKTPFHNELKDRLLNDSLTKEHYKKILENKIVK